MNENPHHKKILVEAEKLYQRTVMATDNYEQEAYHEAYLAGYLAAEKETEAIVVAAQALADNLIQESQASHKRQVAHVRNLAVMGEGLLAQKEAALVQLLSAKEDERERIRQMLCHEGRDLVHNAENLRKFEHDSVETRAREWAGYSIQSVAQILWIEQQHEKRIEECNAVMAVVNNAIDGTRPKGHVSDMVRPKTHAAKDAGHTHCARDVALSVMAAGGEKPTCAACLVGVEYP